MFRLSLYGSSITENTPKPLSKRGIRNWLKVKVMFIVLVHELLFLFAPCSQFIDTCLNPFLKRKLLTTCSYFTSIPICRLNHYAIGVKILSHSMSIVLRAVLLGASWLFQWRHTASSSLIGSIRRICVTWISSWFFLEGFSIVVLSSKSDIVLSRLILATKKQSP